MASAFDGLQRASFGGIEFPIRTARCKGTYRHHDHIYLKTPGAATEKMGRGLYRFEMAGVFDVNVPGYANLWPGALSQMRRLYEQGATAPLVYPSIGSVPCFIPEWDQEMDLRIRSGETAQLIFQEEQSAAFLQQALIKVTSTSVNTAHAALQITADTLNPRPDIFDTIQDKVNGVLALYDQAELRQNLLAARIESLSELIREADRDIEALQDPSNFTVVWALQDLLASTLQLTRDITQQQGDPRIYVVPMTMTVGAISNAIYGDTSHFDDIVSNNTIEDPLTVIAGTQIIYFPSGILNAA